MGLRLGFGVSGLGFGVSGLVFGVLGSGFGVWGLGFSVLGLGYACSLGKPLHQRAGLQNALNAWKPVWLCLLDLKVRVESLGSLV